jgi:hypothetical protein
MLPLSFAAQPKKHAFAEPPSLAPASAWTSGRQYPSLQSESTVHASPTDVSLAHVPFLQTPQHFAADGLDGSHDCPSARHAVAPFDGEPDDELEHASANRTSESATTIMERIRTMARMLGGERDGPQARAMRSATRKVGVAISPMLR